MRIITGKMKGLKLKTPAGFSTRPTSDRVKESLFSVLNGLINFSEVDSVLDIFAGTGALGLEAISRGARTATFIDFATTEIISENVRRAKLESVTEILRGDFAKMLKALARQERKFDLIFIDPPYKKNFFESTLEIIAEKKLLNEGGLIVVEHGAAEILNAEDFVSIRKINYGKTTSVEFLRLSGSAVE
ncbi:MAG: 16S rRNA (guanine(966)-N(2))-methyltransferase RsmD [Selenomonadaceae bacterium]|nr:16S rRNA (guanine(966)-N(2))-methyltransferase RsmD [Selenomonadaceae bacterium]